MTDDDVACLPEKTKRPWPLYYCKLAAMLMHILLDSLKTLAHKSNPTGLLVYWQHPLDGIYIAANVRKYNRL